VLTVRLEGAFKLWMVVCEERSSKRAKKRVDDVRLYYDTFSKDSQEGDVSLSPQSFYM
jgi:hypothetical protein